MNICPIVSVDFLISLWLPKVLLHVIVEISFDFVIFKDLQFSQLIFAPDQNVRLILQVDSACCKISSRYAIQLLESLVINFFSSFIPICGLRNKHYRKFSLVVLVPTGLILHLLLRHYPASPFSSLGSRNIIFLISFSLDDHHC